MTDKKKPSQEIKARKTKYIQSLLSKVWLAYPELEDLSSETIKKGLEALAEKADEKFRSGVVAFPSLTSISQTNTLIPPEIEEEPEAEEFSADEF